MKRWAHSRPRVAGGGCAASVASLMLGIFLLDRETRTAKFQSADNIGHAGGISPPSFFHARGAIRYFFIEFISLCL